MFVAGSVRRGEEGLLDAVRRLVVEAREIRLLLVPRHLREVSDWEAACIRRGLACRRFSIAGIAVDDDLGEGPWGLDGSLRSRDNGLPPVIIVDRIGILTRLYRLADAAFVGGTWIPLGGHNLFEPAREGIPVLFGPSIEGVSDVAEALLSCGGGIKVRDPDALAEALARLLVDPTKRAAIGSSARKAAESVAGAAERTMAGLREAGFPEACVTEAPE